MPSIANIFSKLACAARNSELLQQHAAVLTRSGYRPAMTINNYNHYTSCRHSVDKPSLHAEKVALSKYHDYYQQRNANVAKIRRKMKRTSMIIVRLNPAQNGNRDSDDDGDDITILPQFKNSTPCYHCLELLKFYGVNKVIFTTDCDEPHCEKGKSIECRQVIKWQPWLTTYK